MDVEKGYKYWSKQYDSNLNKTRDLEAVSLRETLAGVNFDHCLELGCGTGKNTEWLITRGRKMTAVDLSEEMLAIAQKKVINENVEFVKGDINQDWAFANVKYDLIVCSLVLEHIEDIHRIFRLISQYLSEDGLLYIGELHPFKQYSGTKAHYETEDGKQYVTAFTHHISEYLDAGQQAGLALKELREYFDDGDTESVPRILTMTFRKEL